MAEQAVLISAGSRHLGCELKKDKACLMTECQVSRGSVCSGRRGKRCRISWGLWTRLAHTDCVCKASANLLCIFPSSVMNLR